jgi:hypothetical protein
MAWTLVYRDDGGKERRQPPMLSRDDALRQAVGTKGHYTIVRIEGPEVTLDATEIEKELASGKYVPPGTAIPKR